MPAREQLIRARMGMLALAEQLQNISAACKRAGISRSHFYEIKAAFERYGSDGLAPQERRRPRMPNETPCELVEKILYEAGEMTFNSEPDTVGSRRAGSWLGSPWPYTRPSLPSTINFYITWPGMADSTGDGTLKKQ